MKFKKQKYIKNSFYRVSIKLFEIKLTFGVIQ